MEHLGIFMLVQNGVLLEDHQPPQPQLLRLHSPRYVVGHALLQSSLAGSRGGGENGQG